MGTERLVEKTEACVFGGVRLRLLLPCFELFEPLPTTQMRSATKLLSIQRSQYGPSP